MSELDATISTILATGRGILAADESLPTLGKRFAEVGIPVTAESRRAYRELLFSARGLEPFISGAILFDETLRQTSQSGAPMSDLLSRRGILVGIKVDRGTVELAGFPGEKITEGLDGLRQRLTEYRELGARFTKWRAVLRLGDRLPSSSCIEMNAVALAQFAALSQEAGLVPLVEPEVLMAGRHTLEQCEEVTTRCLRAVFRALIYHRVGLERMLLKTGMVLPGGDCPEQAGTEELAETTLRCLRRSVPAAVPGVLFLSGGQSDELATTRLGAICKLATGPWRLSFSFGRALQSSAMHIWKGSAENIPAAQSALLHQARCNGLALRRPTPAQSEGSSPA